ncbi:phage tail sheath family protein [Cellulomonas sp. NPDC055163]
MPEYLTPGVYVEETSYRSKTIEGVATSTFGMAGQTLVGPVPYVLTPAAADPWPELVMVPSPTLVTSFTEFERAFGGLGDIGGADSGQKNYLAFAARAFFGNGGRRLYVSRVFPWTGGQQTRADFAGLPLGAPAGGGIPLAAFRARWPGVAGNDIAVSVSFQRGKNVLVSPRVGPPTLQGLTTGAAVEEFPDRTKPLPPRDPQTGRAVAPNPANVRVVVKDAAGKTSLRDGAGATTPLADDGRVAYLPLTVTVTVRWGARRSDSYPGLELDPAHPRGIANVLQAEDPADEMALVWFDTGAKPAASLPVDQLVTALSGLATEQFLTGAAPATALAPSDIAGGPADPDAAKRAATGLAALLEIEDIAIVSSPDAARLTTDADRATATSDLIAHCQATKAYRIGIVDPPKDSSISEVRSFRAQFDSSYAAVYYPWVRIVDPTVRPDPGAPPALLDLPPSGFAAGIYARSDIARGVHKAPANEVVLGITGFVQNVTFDRQSVLNPEGINALRFFEGRANRVWGARTMSSDPEWKYVNIRRLFLFVEHSVDRATQWAVFEPNNERLWASIRQSVEDFLYSVWRSGALMGTKPEDAYFVRCDRTTMTQNDLDNGRMICEVGIAPAAPAEFVIFRIGQWTADAHQG